MRLDYISLLTGLWEFQDFYTASMYAMLIHRVELCYLAKCISIWLLKCEVLVEIVKDLVTPIFTTKIA